MELPAVTIDKWYGGKSAAVALTFDDWTPGHAAVAGPILNDAGIEATFFVTLANFAMNPGLDHWYELQELSRKGHEIGNKTRSFSDLSTASPAQLHAETRGAQRELEEQLYGVQVLSFCYPFGKYNASVVEEVKKTHLAARAYDETPPSFDHFAYDFARAEDDYYSLRTLALSERLSAPEFAVWLERVQTGTGFLPCTIHGVYSDEFPRDRSLYNAIHEQLLRAYLQELEQRAASIWIATFAKAILYHRMVSAATCRVHWLHSCSIQIELELAESKIREARLPLTVCMQKPDDARGFRVWQAEQELTFQETQTELRFDMKHNAQAAIVSWQRTLL